MPDISLAPSLSRVAPSQIREIADVAFSMDDVLKLHFGESNIQTPQYLKDAAYQAMNDGYTFYTENAGLPGLRNAIAKNPAGVWAGWSHDRTWLKRQPSLMSLLFPTHRQ